MRRLIVEADGGSRGNPGPAGFGALVRDAGDESVLARRNGFLGRVTNNVAEYRGLIAGLQAAAAIDPKAALEVRMDSKLVVEQMSGRWQVKHPDMRPLASEASKLAASFADVRFSWIPRARNAEADKLANEAMDAGRSTYDELDDALLTEVAETVAPVTVSDREGLPRWRAPSEFPATRITLLRHGQTVHSIESRFSGSSDPELTDLGRRQATRAAARLGAAGGFDAVITSPRTRARQTAALAGEALGLTPSVEEAWRECDFGVFEGMSWQEISAAYPDELAAWLADPTVPPPGGESFAEVRQRVSVAWQALTEGKLAGARVLVVSHVTPIKIVGQLVLDAPSTVLHTLHLDLASLTRADLFADRPAVLRGWNDTAHLDGLA